jgi:hypothetical protein
LTGQKHNKIIDYLHLIAFLTVDDIFVNLRYKIRTLETQGGALDAPFQVDSDNGLYGIYSLVVTTTDEPTQIR